MSWIVLEIFSGADHASIVTNPDGTNKVFDTEQEANDEALLCQEGVYLEL